jgi:hypothetical protein
MKDDRQSPTAVWVANLFLALLLLGHVLLFVEGPGKALELLAKLPAPIATMITGIVGLGTIAWQTRIGFRNLIDSQEHRAKLDREARRDQASINRDEKQREVDRDKQLVASALHAELIGLLPRVQQMQQWLSIQRAVMKQMGSHKTTFRLPRYNVPVYDHNLSKIGLLGPSVGGDVIQVYSNAVAVGEYNKDTHQITDTPANMLVPIVESMVEAYENWTGEIVHVAQRLMHVQGFRQDDPGTLFTFRKARDANSLKKPRQAASGTLDRPGR